MSKKQTLQKEIKGKTDQELANLIQENKKSLRVERFKDKFSKKAGVIKAAKRQVARAYTELAARSNTK